MEYPPPREGVSGFSCSNTGQFLGAMVNPPNSGGAVVCFCREYQYLLKNWDAWVTEQKEYVARKKYKEEQINPAKLYQIKNCTKAQLQGFMTEYEYSGTMEEFVAHIMAIDDDYKKESEREHAKCERERFEGKLGALEHHYKHPSRWYDNPSGSTLCKHPSSVSAEHIAAMELRIPGYTVHLANIIKTWQADYDAYHGGRKLLSMTE